MVNTQNTLLLNIETGSISVFQVSKRNCVEKYSHISQFVLFAYVKSSFFIHVILRLEKFCRQKLKQSFEANILLAEYGRPHKRETLQKGAKNGHVTSPIIS